jgi:HAD superfamily hydrolase (TIGR01549 family)
LSFDLDDTLWPCQPVIQHAENMLYRWLSVHVPVITERYGADELRQKRLQLYAEYEDLAHDLTQLRIRSFEQLAREFALDLYWIKPAFEVFYEARQRVTLFDDVKPVLDELKQTYKLVSLTNGNASTVKTGVDHWFDFSLSSAIVGSLKSESQIYRQVQQRANIDAGQMVHVGDHPLQDIAGARSAGVYAIWLNREQRDWQLENCQPDAVITTLHELPAMLKDL